MCVHWEDVSTAMYIPMVAVACNAARSAAFAPPQAVIRVQRKLHFHTTAQLWYLHTCGASNSLSEATSYRCISSGTSYEAVFHRCVFIGRMFPLPCISQWLRHHILRRIGCTAAYAAVTSRPAGAGLNELLALRV